MGRALAIALLLALGGCTTLRVYTDDPRAQIFVDGRLRGRGEVMIRRTGPPHSAQVLVKAEDGRLATANMRRQFTLLTVVFGLPTYGICLAMCWEYPGASLFVPLPGRAPTSGWDAADSPWLRPPAGWDEPSAPGRVPAPADAASPWSSPPPAAPPSGGAQVPGPPR